MFGIYVAPNMRTISLCEWGSPCANILGKTGQTHNFWGGNFCGVVIKKKIVRVLQNFALDFFFTTPLRL